MTENQDQRGAKRIAVGSDHAGFELKEALAQHLRDSGYEVVDVGTHSRESVDYPDYGEAVGQSVTKGLADVGLAVCGTGIGISIAANKVDGVRAAVVHDVTTARLAKEHNDANVLCMGSRIVGPEVATEALDAFLATHWAGGRHQRRIEKISAIEHGHGG